MPAAPRRLIRRIPSIAWRDEKIARLEQDLRKKDARLAQRGEKLRRAEQSKEELRAEVRELRSTVGGLRKLKEQKVDALREKDRELKTLRRSHAQDLEAERRRPEKLTFRSMITAGSALQEAALSVEERWMLPRLQTDEHKLRNYSLAQSHGIATPQILQVQDDPADLDLRRLDESAAVLKADSGHSAHAVFLLERTAEGWQTLDGRHRLTGGRLPEDMASHLRRFRGPYFLEELLDVPDQGDAALPAVPVPDDVKVYTAYGEVLQILLMRPESSGDTARGRFSRRYLDHRCHDLGEVAEFVQHDPDIPLPDHLDEIIGQARTLSLASGLSFVRVDMFSTARGPVFGELTPRPGGKHRYREDHDTFLVESWLRAARRLSQDTADGRPAGTVFGTKPYTWWYPEAGPEDGPDHPSRWPRPVWQP